jgi:hypothetical protein
MEQWVDAQVQELFQVSSTGWGAKKGSGAQLGTGSLLDTLPHGEIFSCRWKGEGLDCASNSLCNLGKAF